MTLQQVRTVHQEIMAATPGMILITRTGTPGEARMMMSHTGARGILEAAIAAARMVEVSSRSREDMDRGTDPQGMITRSDIRVKIMASTGRTGITDITGAVGMTVGAAGMSLGAESDETHVTADGIA